MAIKVITSELAWEGFLRRAKRAFPSEYIEAIWGEETVDSFRITDFKIIRLNKATAKSLDYDENELKRQKWLAEKASKTYLGTIHTHPRRDFDTAPSKTDHHESKGEKIMGIVVLYKKKDSNRFVIETDWWIPQPIIEFVLLK